MARALRCLGLLGLMSVLVGALWLPPRVARACEMQACGCPCAEDDQAPSGPQLRRPPCCARGDADMGPATSVVSAPSPAAVASAPSVPFAPGPQAPLPRDAAGRRTVAPATGPPLWLMLQRLVR